MAKKASEASSKVEGEVAIAASLIDRAGLYSKSIRDITGSTTKPNQSVSDSLQNLQAGVIAIQQNNLINALTDAKTSLDSLESTRKSACGDQPKQPATPQQDVTDAQAACKKAQNDASGKGDALVTALASLQSALASTGPYLANRFDELAAKLKPFSENKLIALPGGDGKITTEPSVLLQVLPRGIPALREVLDSESEYQRIWESIKPVLHAASNASPPPDSGKGTAPPDADAELQKLKPAIDSIESGIAGWFAIISAQLAADAQTLDGKLSGVSSDPAKNSAEALGVVRDATGTLASAQTVVDVWPPLVGFLVDGQPKEFNLSTAKTNFEDLQKNTNVLRASISRVHDAIAGDFTDFETDQVSLYYFSDIPRLMSALNDRFQTTGGVAEAKAEADAQRTSLTRTELDLADAQATVNRFQKQVLDLQEQQRQANEKLKGLNSNVSKLASRLKQAQNDKQKADDNLQGATGNQDASATGNPGTGASDPTLAAAVEKDKAKQTAAAAKLSDAQSNYDAAKTERDNAQAQADDTQNQKDSLPSKLKEAQQAMSDVQTEVSAQRRKMLLTAQAESDAFAFARDNSPFLFAPADASSSDPAKRVMLYAFNDSKTIFMRGKPRDMSAVKRMIAEFDKPAPQARLTLWTFQLSADSGQKTNKKAAKQLNESMEIVDQELGDTRALENTTLASFRGTINDFVAAAALYSTAKKDCEGLGQTDCAKLKRITFYDPAVLTQLNFKESDLKVCVAASAADCPQRRKTALERLERLIPDPAQTTTLGEALLVLNLARPVTRNCVSRKFETEIRTHTPKVSIEIDLLHSNDDFLPLAWHALGVWELNSGCPNEDPFKNILQFDEPTAGLSSSQLEIVTALRVAHDRSVLREVLNQLPIVHSELLALQDMSLKLVGLKQEVEKLEGLGLSKSEAHRLKALEVNPTESSHDYAMERARVTDKAIRSLPAADQASYEQADKDGLSLKARIDTIKKRSADVLDTLSAYGIYAGDLGDPENLRRVIEQVLDHPGLSTASPRVAAADQMLKELIIAVEDDLARDFVQPMIVSLRTKLMKTGASVGVVQRESMLATNRGVARIDPRASVQLAVGDQEDILTGIQQLAQLYGTVQSGGALTALGALQQQPREPQPEIYALNTGNRFQVTPVFDPSGQALRFKFDFVATANVQEPNGTTNTQLSRIERHTINTEVQLSNLETREISRFEVNARLGLPTTYWGGIPILKDIPYLRPWVPLVGWFVRKGGSNAVAQQSVIFGQTTMYPTIGDLVNLVSDPGAVLDSDAPAAASTP